MNKQIIEAKEQYTNLRDTLKHQNNTLSNIRLLLFVITIAFFILGLKDNSKIFYISSFFFFFIFIIFVIIHSYVDSKYKRSLNYLNIIEEYYMRTNDKWKELANYDKSTQDYLQDLNILGNGSLLTYLDFTKTLGGQKRLVNKMSLENIAKKDILMNQEAITELKQNFAFSLDIQELLSSKEHLKKTDFKENLNIFNIKIKPRKITLVFSWFMSLVAIILLVLGLFNIINLYYYILYMLIELAISHFYFIYHSEAFETIAKSARQFIPLKETFKYIENSHCQSKKLKTLKQEIIKGHAILDDIISVSTLDSFRTNFITYTLCNSLFGLNFLIIHRYSKLINNDTKTFQKSIEALEEIECLISLTTIPYLKKNITLPSIEETTNINFTNLRHPLLDEDKCVPNSFTTEANLNIITGSNMSGKTSFMKTVGTSLLLAYMGTYVNAETFSCSIMKIFTSINVLDDINNSISTFYGELLRIKKILDYNREHHEPLVIFIDEIFKGTNYNDRILGAKEVLKKLSKLDCIVFLTTHDFELCEIDNKKINNYHFSEKYIKNKIIFDYKIKEGKCQTTNAKYLMKQMNIID